MKVTLVSYTPNPVETIASAAAITRGVTIEEFKQRTDRYKLNLLENCYKQGHWSVFEFADFDFQVEGVSRVFETQAVRSRLASYEWQTGRIEQENIPCDFVLQQDNLITEAVHVSIEDYERLEVAGYAPEDSRYALPQGIGRKGRIKRNFRNLLETAQIRLCSKAQTEYREFMLEVKRIITEDVSDYLGYLLQPKCVYMMYCNEDNSCRFNGVPTKKEAEQKLLRGVCDDNTTSI